MTLESAESVEILRPLSAKEVDELLELYERKYGSSHFHYILMYNQRKWDRQLEELSAKNDDKYEEDDWIAFRKRFFTHRDVDFRMYGTYVSLHKELVQSVSFHSWQPEFKDLYECLDKTNLIDWKQGPLFTNVDIEYAEQVKLIAESKGASVDSAIRCHGLVLPHEKALSLPKKELPSGYRLTSLQPSDAKMIHSMWAHSNECTEKYIKGLILLNRTLGIYRETDDALVAWIFQNEFSGIGILEVLPSEQRKGFGRLLASWLCKDIADSEPISLNAFIVLDNFRSEALLEQIGFKKTVAHEWIQLNKA